MRPIFLAVILALAAWLAAPAAQPQGPAPGQLRPRPAEGRAPELPPPSILDYKPRSTLVVAEHEVPRARFPVVDIHSHHPTPMTPDYYARVVASMDPLNLQVLVNLSGGSGDRLRRGLEVIRTTPHPNRMVLFANIDFSGVGPGFGARAARQLEADIEAGAAGLKIFKNLGLETRRADGTRLKVDDPELDPIWETCARLGVPVLIHTGDPSEFFQPLDLQNERWLELALFRDRRFFDRARFPAFEELMGERDRMFAKHPDTKFIVAHMGWHAQDLGRLGAMLDRMPNLYPEVGAVLYDLGRQPRTAHDFFVKYQDRLLFGKDSYQPDEFPYFFRVFETNDEYFDYYRDYHAFWKLYGIGLPDQVLRKLYYENALRVTPGLPRTGLAG